MPSRPLWSIPDPADVLRQAQARAEVAERQKRDRATLAAERKARAKREAVLMREAETRRRAEERQQWMETHKAPTAEELAELMREKAPSLHEAMRRKGRIES